MLSKSFKKWEYSESYLHLNIYLLKFIYLHLSTYIYIFENDSVIKAFNK